MKTWFRWTIMVGLGLGLSIWIAWACTSISSEGSSDSLGRTCVKSDQCAYGESCVAYGLDCPEGESQCTPNALCVPLYCTGNSDCMNTSELKCCNGECVDLDNACSAPCRDDSDCPNGVCVAGGCIEIPGVTGGTCSEDGECPEGLLCVAGYCAENPGVDGGMCDKDSDCPTGECFAGFCIGGNNGECQEASDCEGEDAVCLLGYCVNGTAPADGDFDSEIDTDFENPLTQCTKDSDCLEGQTCESGFCLGDIQIECTSDEDCPPGYSCQSKMCEPGWTQNCTQDSDCNDGFVCDQGQCLPDGVTRCEGDEDCDGNQACLAGFCITVGPTDGDVAGCESDWDCDDGQVCLAGMCLEDSSVPTQCQSDYDCQPDETCVLNFCIGVPQPGGACQSSEDCSGGVCFMNRCWGGESTQTCRRDSDCPEGYECIQQMCLQF